MEIIKFKNISEPILVKLLIASKIKTTINQYELSGGVAQLVRARDS